MKRGSILFLVLQLALACFTQTMTIHYKNGQNVTFNVKSIDYIDFQEEKEGGTTVTEGEAVDLGLSVLWASHNVGATSCEEFGDKYAWGETSPKEKYKRETYIYYDSDTQSYIDIGGDIKGTDFDAAHVQWGNNWRMPTYNELYELASKCTWKWSSYNGVNGFLVSSVNGNSLFFPVGDKTIHIWASDIRDYEKGKATNTLEMACCLGFSNGNPLKYIGISKYDGGFIRPVMSK